MQSTSMASTNCHHVNIFKSFKCQFNGFLNVERVETLGVFTDEMQYNCNSIQFAVVWDGETTEILQFTAVEIPFVYTIYFSTLVYCADVQQVRFSRYLKHIRKIIM